MQLGGGLVRGMEATDVVMAEEVVGMQTMMTIMDPMHPRTTVHVTDFQVQNATSCLLKE